MSLLGVLGGIGRNVSEFADERKQEQRQQLLDEERKRKERMDMLARFMGMIKDPQGQAELFRRSQQGEDIMGMLPSILDRQAQQQAQQQRQQEQQQRESSELDDFVTGATGANISGTQDKFTEQLTEEQARRLGRSGQTGQGLDTLIRMRNEVGQRGMAGQDAQKQQQEQDMIDKIASAKDIDALRSLRAVAKPQFGEGSRVLKMIDERMDAGFGMPEAPTATGGDPKRLATQQNQIDAINTFSAQSQVLEKLLQNPDVASELGPVQGRINRSMQGGFLDIMDPTTEFTVTQGVLANMADAFLRSRTGAAAQDEEVQKVSRDIVGSVSLTADQIRALTKTLRTMMQLEKTAIERGEATEQDLATAALELSSMFKNPPSVLAPQQQGNTPNKYDEMTDQELDEMLKRRGLAQ
jgi:hypothetical protein